VTHPYGARDVERLLRLPRATLRALVAAGFVTPARGPRNAWRFSFQDLIVLRTAQALADAHVPQRRIIKSVRDRFGAAVLLVEQNASLALAVADRGYIMQTGRIVAEGLIEQLRDLDLVRETYLGDRHGRRDRQGKPQAAR